jgi:hypothetical protein
MAQRIRKRIDCLQSRHAETLFPPQGSPRQPLLRSPNKLVTGDIDQEGRQP